MQFEIGIRIADWDLRSECGIDDSDWDLELKLVDVLMKN